MNQFLRSHPSAGTTAGAPRALSAELSVQDGYELALAAALGGRLDAALVEDVRGAQELLDGAGPEGAVALLAAGEAARAEATQASPPAPGARPMLELLSGPPAVLALAGRLLGDAWVVERLEDLPEDFRGVAVTRAGRVWFGAWGEVRQLAEGGTELLLARRNERDRLVAEVERVAGSEQLARAALETALAGVREADDARTGADEALRGAERAAADATEVLERSRRALERRRSEPGEGPLAVRKAELEGELAAERRQAEQLAEQRRAQLARAELLRARERADRLAAPLAERLGAAIAAARAGVEERVQALEAELAQDREAGEEMTARLRDCAAREAEIQALCAPPARRSRSRPSPPSGCATRPPRSRPRARRSPRSWGWRVRRRPPSRWSPSAPASCRHGSSVSRAGASSSVRSTRSPRTSTPRRSRTSRSSRDSARTSRRRCASCAR